MTGTPETHPSAPSRSRQRRARTLAKTHGYTYTEALRILDDVFTSNRPSAPADLTRYGTINTEGFAGRYGYTGFPDLPDGFFPDQPEAVEDETDPFGEYIPFPIDLSWSPQETVVESLNRMDHVRQVPQGGSGWTLMGSEQLREALIWVATNPTTGMWAAGSVPTMTRPHPDRPDIASTHTDPDLVRAATYWTDEPPGSRFLRATKFIARDNRRALATYLIADRYYWETENTDLNDLRGEDWGEVFDLIRWDTGFPLAWRLLTPHLPDETIEQVTAALSTGSTFGGWDWNRDTETAAWVNYTPTEVRAWFTKAERREALWQRYHWAQAIVSTRIHTLTGQPEMSGGRLRYLAELADHELFANTDNPDAPTEAKRETQPTWEDAHDRLTRWANRLTLRDWEHAGYAPIRVMKNPVTISDHLRGR